MSSRVVWIGGALAVGTAVTGGVLIYRNRRKLARAPVPVPVPHLSTGRDTPAPPAAKRTAVLRETQAKTTEGRGSVTGDDDPTLGYTERIFKIFALPAQVGTFDVQVCATLDFRLDDKTWNAIVDGAGQRLFWSPDLHLSAQLHYTGAWFGDQIHDLEATGKVDADLCPAYVAFPEQGAFFENDEGGWPSWGGYLSRMPLPGEKWGNGYLPRFGVFVRDDALFMRIWVAPMPKREGPGLYTAQKTKYGYEFKASIEYRG